MIQYMILLMSKINTISIQYFLGLKIQLIMMNMRQREKLQIMLEYSRFILLDLR